MHIKSLSTRTALYQQRTTTFYQIFVLLMIRFLCSFFLLVSETHCHSLAKISFEFELYLCLFLHGFRIYDQCKSLKIYLYRKTVITTVLKIISNWKFNMIIRHYSARCTANFKRISLFFTELELCFWVPLFLHTW